MSQLSPSTLKGPVTLFVTCLKSKNVLTKLFLPSVATDGKDEHGLKKLSLNAMLAKITKKIWFVLSDEICLKSLSYLYIICVWFKASRNYFGTES